MVGMRGRSDCAAALEEPARPEGAANLSRKVGKEWWEGGSGSWACRLRAISKFHSRCKRRVVAREDGGGWIAQPQGHLYSRVSLGNFGWGP
jgi:hypothetical protein